MRKIVWLPTGPLGAVTMNDEIEIAVPVADSIASWRRVFLGRNGADPRDLLRTRRIQARDVSGMHAMFRSISHFVGHTHQIVQWTRLLRGEAYRFDFVPKSREEGGPP